MLLRQQLSRARGAACPHTMFSTWHISCHNWSIQGYSLPHTPLCYGLIFLLCVHAGTHTWAPLLCRESAEGTWEKGNGQVTYLKFHPFDFFNATRVIFNLAVLDKYLHFKSLLRLCLFLLELICHDLTVVSNHICPVLSFLHEYWSLPESKLRRVHSPTEHT